MLINRSIWIDGKSIAQQDYNPLTYFHGEFITWLYETILGALPEITPDTEVEIQYSSSPGHPARHTWEQISYSYHSITDFRNKTRWRGRSAGKTRKTPENPL